MKSLLSLKAEFKGDTGLDWNPNLLVDALNEPETNAVAEMSSSDTEMKLQQIDAQGNLVRELKQKGADKVWPFFLSKHEAKQHL